MDETRIWETLARRIGTGATTCLWRVGLLAAMLLGAATPSAAQDIAEPDSCRVLLTEAQMRYVDQDYIAVESLVLTCAYHPAALPAHLLEGYRLMTLAFIRQDLLHEAQTTVLKLLAVDFQYEPDPVQDPPFYVALVGSVKDQLQVASSVRVGPVRAATARVNVNTATADQLETVPGIGPVKAGRIVAYRDQNGPFRRIEDLQNVSGIGPRTVEQLTPYLVLEGGSQTVRAAGGVASPRARPAADRPALPAAAPTGALVNLNTASAAELETLPGIGPAYAARIIAYREEIGPFQRVEDVVAVRGIGPRTLERLAPYATVGPPSGQ